MPRVCLLVALGKSLHPKFFANHISSINTFVSLIIRHSFPATATCTLSFSCLDSNIRVQGLFANLTGARPLGLINIFPIVSSRTPGISSSHISPLLLPHFLLMPPTHLLCLSSTSLKQMWSRRQCRALLKQ